MIAKPKFHLDDYSRNETLLTQLEVKGEAQGEVVDVTEEVFAFSIENTDEGQSSSGQEQQ